MWKKGGGRFARVPGKSSVAALIGNVVFNINSPFFFPKETKLNGLDFFFFFRFQQSGGSVFLALCAI